MASIISSVAFGGLAMDSSHAKIGHVFEAEDSSIVSHRRQCCQVPDCCKDLSTGKAYFIRHKVCREHSNARSVMLADALQRFCQQCGKFHPLPQFDDTKRTCRNSLKNHNLRRKKPCFEHPHPAYRPALPRCTQERMHCTIPPATHRSMSHRSTYLAVSPENYSEAVRQNDTLREWQCQRGSSAMSYITIHGSSTSAPGRMHQGHDYSSLMNDTASRLQLHSRSLRSRNNSSSPPDTSNTTFNVGSTSVDPASCTASAFHIPAFGLPTINPEHGTPWSNTCKRPSFNVASTASCAATSRVPATTCRSSSTPYLNGVTMPPPFQPHDFLSQHFSSLHTRPSRPAVNVTTEACHLSRETSQLMEVWELLRQHAALQQPPQHRHISSFGPSEVRLPVGAHSNWSSVPHIVVTASSDQHHIDRAQPVDYLAKDPLSLKMSAAQSLSQTQCLHRQQQNQVLSAPDSTYHHSAKHAYRNGAHAPLEEGLVQSASSESEAAHMPLSSAFGWEHFAGNPGIWTLGPSDVPNCEQHDHTPEAHIVPPLCHAFKQY